MTRTIALVAGEASGDALGADLIAELRRRLPEVQVMGAGGPRMAAQGLHSAIDIDGLSVLGFVEGLKAYSRVVRLANAASGAIAAAKPDAVVLIDSWGFTLRVAQRLRPLLPQTPLIKYIGPQVFATRPGRAKTLAATVDHLICIHDFETAYYAPFGLPCTVCGHPAIGRYRPGDGPAWRARHGFAPDTPLLLLLPGSRRAEVRRVGPLLTSAAQALLARHPSARAVILAAGPVAAEVTALAANLPGAQVVQEGADKEDAFAAATVALAASGTVTTEVALQGAPLVIAYRIGALSWVFVKRALKAKWATLLNIAADAEVAPEFLQDRATPEAITAAAGRLLTDEAARQAQIAAQNAALIKMGRGLRPAAEIAADVVESLIEKGAAAVRSRAT
jgi:lipid-A-disaccharide synthase